MAIQMRRGAYGDFDPTRMLPGEWAVVLSDDADTTDGYAVYICYAAGLVKRVVSSDELASLVNNIYQDVEDYVDDAFDVSAILQAATDARVAANTAQAAIDAIGDISEIAVPLMSATTRGGAKMGSGFIMSSAGVLSVDPDSIELSTMSADTRGVAKLGGGLAVADDTLSVDPMTTAQIDEAVAYDEQEAEEPLTGANPLAQSGLAYLWEKIKAWGAETFAALSHVHPASDITSGTLAVARGGTGVTSNPSMLVNLATTSADTVFEASPRPGVTGELPIANGGTGAATAANARANLGVAASSHTHSAADITSDTLAIANGGTGADTVADARYNLMQGIAETTSSPSDAAHVLFTRGDGSTDDVFYTRPWSAVYSDLGFDSDGNLDFGGALSVGGTSTYLLFLTTAIASFSPPTGVSSCMVLDTSDYGLYWYTS